MCDSNVLYAHESVSRLLDYLNGQIVDARFDLEYTKGDEHVKAHLDKLKKLEPIAIEMVLYFVPALKVIHFVLNNYHTAEDVDEMLRNLELLKGVYKDPD